ncbi:uncharacterized protein TNCV_861841 [Trichonephila clavipes]|nr:uncharacterized protein TNCV_861841 [Trichonephila clavipes]
MASGNSLPQFNLSVQGGTQGVLTVALNIPTQLACAYLKDLLTGRALDWFDALGYRVVQEKATDYAHLKQALTELVRNRSELETRFYASYQNLNQRPSDFVYELLKMHKQLKLDMVEEKLLYHVISRLEPQLLDYVQPYSDNSRPQRESNRFGGQGVGDNWRFDSRHRSGQSDHRFNNQGGRQGGSRNGAFRGQNGQDRMTPVDLPYAPILLNETFITDPWDTGMEKSFISEEVYRRYFSYRPRQKTKDRVVVRLNCRFGSEISRKPGNFTFLTKCSTNTFWESTL